MGHWALASPLAFQRPDDAARGVIVLDERVKWLKQLFKWLWKKGEIAPDPMERVKPPEVVEQPVPVLSGDELKTLIKASEGSEVG